MCCGCEEEPGPGQVMMMMMMMMMIMMMIIMMMIMKGMRGGAGYMRTQGDNIQVSCH